VQDVDNVATRYSMYSYLLPLQRHLVDSRTAEGNSDRQNVNKDNITRKPS